MHARDRKVFRRCVSFLRRSSFSSTSLKYLLYQHTSREFHRVILSKSASAFSFFPIYYYLHLRSIILYDSRFPPSYFLRLSLLCLPLSSPCGSQRPIRATIGQPLHQLPRFKSQLGVPSEAIFSPPELGVSLLAAFTLLPALRSPCASLPLQIPPPFPSTLFPSFCYPLSLPSLAPFVSFPLHLPLPSSPLAW